MRQKSITEYVSKILTANGYMIFEPHEDPIPTDEDGKYVWIEIKGVEIVEIVNYHGK